jgi:hypothetical protein
MYRTQSVASFRPLLFALLALSLSLLFSGILHQSASALYSENAATDKITIGGMRTADGSTCTETDLTLTWNNMFLDELGQFTSPYNYKTSWNYGYPNSYGQGMEAFAQRFRDKISNGDTSGWAVANSTYGEQHYNNDTGFDINSKQITLYLFDPSTTFTASDGNLVANQSVQYMDLFLNHDAGCRFQVNAPYQSTSVNLSRHKFLFFASDNITYDSSYTGTHLPLSVGGDEPEKTTIRPEFTYQLNDKKVTAHDYNFDLPTVTPDDGYTIKGYSIEWAIFKCDAYDEVVGCTGSHLVDGTYEIQDQDQDYSKDLTEYGDYTLTATYLVQQCYRYPSYPATPDYCFYIPLNTELPQYDFTSTTTYLQANGQSITGDTKNEQCDVSGFCVDPATICFSQPDFFSTMTCKLNKQMNVGLLNPSISAFKNLFTSLTVPAIPTCYIPLQDVVISSGQSYPLSLYSAKACASAQQFRNAFPILSILINFFLAMLVLFMLVKIINRLTDHKETDIIEGIA